MRRGLMAWDAEELPLDILKQRLERLQSTMAAAGYDAMILYTNFIRSGAVSYVTGFSPYWADGVLLVPRAGEPVFATTLSKRVGQWIQTVKPIGDLVCSPTPGVALGKHLAEQGAAYRVAILDLDAFPSGLYDQLAEMLPDTTFVDGSDTFAAARSYLDSAERRLLTKAKKIAQEALETLDEGANDAGSAVGHVEKIARLQGAEEAYVAIAPDLNSDRRFLRLSGNRALGRRFAIRATVAYKGSWIRQTKTYATDEKDRRQIARADAWFEGFVSRFDVSRPLRDQIAAALSNLPGAELAGLIAEAAVGTRPLAVLDEAQSLENVPALVVTLGLTMEQVPWCGASLTGLLHGKTA
jgi:creatinase/prolidase-like protein